MGTDASTVIIVSESANFRVKVSRELTRRQWHPVAVSTWQRACEHGLSEACVVITDAPGLAASGADLAVLGIVPGWVPVVVGRSQGSLPSWARHRVREVHKTDVPQYLERLKRTSTMNVNASEPR